MGLLFGSRRTSIDIDQWDIIRTDDEYRRLAENEAPQFGDVVVYRKGAAVTHVAVIARVEPGLSGGSPRIIVVSQWGFDGEYLHPQDVVPPLYGAVSEYWTDRRA